MNFSIVNDEYLDSMRHVTDDYSDKIISEVIKTQHVQDLNKLFSTMMKNDYVISDDIPEPIKRYFNETEKLPPWADGELIKKGEDVFLEHGMGMLLSYFCKSLPECYAGWKGAEVLISTGRINNSIRKRIARTAQFVLNVLSPGGMDQGGKGIETAQKVRLMHASIRYYLQRSGEYDVKTKGLPINQEDMAATLMAFSVVVIEGSETLGIKLKPEEKHALYHTWKCIGYISGIKEELIPETYPEAIRFWGILQKRLFGKSQDGVELTEALQDFLEELIPEKYLKHIVDGMMRTLLGQKVSDMLEVKYNTSALILFSIVKFFLDSIDEISNSSRLTRRLTEKINLKIMLALEGYIEEGDKALIDIPPSLKGSWNMSN